MEERPRGLPRVDPVNYHYSTVQRPPRRQMEGARRALSALDLSVNPDIEADAHYAESELLRDIGHALASSHFVANRHSAHYFSNANLFEASSSSFNYLRYAKAAEMSMLEMGHPHMVVSSLSFAHDLRSSLDCLLLRTPKYLHTLHSLSLDLTSGDTLAVLYTSELEVRSLFRLLTGSSPPTGAVKGTFSLNGHPLSLAQFSARIAFVSSEDPSPSLTVLQHLKSSIDFFKPATDSFDVDRMISQLISSLALTPYADETVENIGQSEKQRLKVAMALLKDTDILVADNITKDMDIYDVAFLVDFLRDWALRLRRIVIMAIAPSTVEILTMFHKAAILASGRLVYCGASNEIVDYFESIGFPCPPFKNPCDYYVDLVTCDHLSSEAHAESVQRISHVANEWNTRASAFQPRKLSVASVSPRIRKASRVGQAIGVFRKLFYVSINSPFSLLLEPLIALVSSFLIAFSFRSMEENNSSVINDRFGMVICLFLLASFLICLGTISRGIPVVVHAEREFLYSDLRQCNYSPVVYSLCKGLFDLPLHLVTTLLLVLPVVSLTPFLRNDVTRGGIDPWATLLFFAIMLIHLTIWRNISLASAHICKCSMSASAITGTLLLLCSFLSGIPVSSGDSRDSMALVSLLSPIHWLSRVLLLQEFSPDQGLLLLLPFAHSNYTQKRFPCEGKTLREHKLKDIPIVTVDKCGFSPGSSVLSLHGFAPSFLVGEAGGEWRGTEYARIGAMVVGVWVGVSAVASALAVAANHRQTRRREE